MEVPEDRYLLVVVLFLDVANTLIREFIALVSSNTVSAGIGTVVMFAIVGSLAVGASFLTLPFTPELNPINGIVWFMQLASSLAYYYSDNISFILVHYGEALGCNDQCMENNRIAAVVLLGTAMLVFNIFPLLFGHIEKILDMKHEKSWYYTLDILAVLLRIDIIFTVIAVMSQTNEFCSLTDRSLGWAMFCICVVFGIAAIIMTCLYTFARIQEDICDNGALLVSLVGVSAFLIIALILYILADNEQPIDCAWGCDSFASNETRIVAELSGTSCNEKANSGMRFGLMSVTAILITVSLIWLGCDAQFISIA